MIVADPLRELILYTPDTALIIIIIMGLVANNVHISSRTMKATVRNNYTGTSGVEHDARQRDHAPTPPLPLPSYSLPYYA